jgi:hypothetical protein
VIIVIVDLQKIKSDVLQNIANRYKNSNDGSLEILELVETTALDTTILVLQKYQEELKKE